MKKMKVELANQFVDIDQLDWNPIKEPVISGISIKPWRIESDGRPSSLLMKFEAGTR